MIGNRTKRRGKPDTGNDQRELAGVPDSQGDGTPDAAAAAPDDLAAAAAQLQAGAAGLRDRADRGDREADAMVAAGDEEAERIKSSVRSQALAAKAQTTADRRKAAGHEEQASLLTAAIAEQGRADEAVQRAAELEAERQQLLAEVADLDGKSARLGAERERAEAELADAKAAVDVGGVTAQRSRLAGIGDLAESVTEQRQRAAQRLQEVGDGTGHTGEHGAACSAAVRHYAKATSLLDLAYPDTEDAAQRRWLAELRATVEANAERIAEETAAAARPQRQQVVYL